MQKMAGGFDFVCDAVLGRTDWQFKVRVARIWEVAGYLKADQVLDKEAFEKQMLEKLIWICSVMLVGARHGRVPVGVVVKEFRSEMKRTVIELWIWRGYDLELHMVHVSPQPDGTNKTAVVAILYMYGSPDPFLSE
ncbi:hypothetical protein P8452_54951 [Trifolium repens]|nr:hypothetical protein P8452_54951 [Trifolium repens]